jgi:site-specific DNA-methyltransferase (adenine-specific)
MNTTLETPLQSLPKPATLWQLGNHRLILGDATKPEIITRLMGEDKATLVLTDPPYGVGYVEGKGEFLEAINAESAKKFKPIEGDATATDYYTFSHNWLSAVQPHLASKNAFYIFNGDTKLRELMNALHDLKFSHSGLLIWLKDRFVVGRKDYHPQHELILYGWYGTHAFYGSKDRTALFYPKPSRSALHPTMKPPALLRRLLYHSSKPGDIVLDPFGGSGSTLIACEQLGRTCYMVEYEEEYCRAIIARWEKLTGKQAIALPN